MITKSCSVQILISLLLLNNISAHRIHRNVEEAKSKPKEHAIEESDRLMITQTGCKYLALTNGESVLFKKDSGNLEHTTMALLSEDTAGQTPKFEMNFAVQSASDLHVLMFTRQNYVRVSKLDADYKISLGTNGNKFSEFFYTALSDNYENFQAIDLQNTSQILTSDKYQKFYVTINNGTLKYGKHCEHEPICSTNSLGLYSPEIVQIGFESKSEHGAKILYDCPSNFAVPSSHKCQSHCHRDIFMSQVFFIDIPDDFYLACSEKSKTAMSYGNPSVAIHNYTPAYGMDEHAFPAFVYSVIKKVCPSGTA